VKNRSAIDWALRCYPAWWRERYADEVRLVSNDLTAEGRSTATVTVNLLGGAVRARTRAPGMPKSYGLWSTRTRVSIAAATLPWMVVAPVVLIAMGNQTLRSHAGPVTSSGISFLPTDLQVVTKHLPWVPAPPLAPAARLVLYAAAAVMLLFLVTFVVLISGWSGLTSAIRHSSSPDRRRLRLLAWVPVLSLLTDIALVFAQNAVRYPDYRMVGGSVAGNARFVAPHLVPYGAHPAEARALAVIVPTVAGVGWLVSIVCVAVAARRADVAPSDLRFGRSVATIVASLFALMMVAYATWGVGLIVQARQAADGNFTTVGFSHPALWLPTVLLLAVGVSVSGMSAWAARSSWKVISLTYVH